MYTNLYVPKSVFVCLVIIPVVITTTSFCGDKGWSCGTGECIAVDQLCDGARDCSDGSDETPAVCDEPECEQFAFRCAFDDCVMKCTNKQNGTHPKCLDEDTFQCSSGECISLDKTCDGLADCSDGTDETANDCLSIICPPIFFRCGYGACIAADKQCNGVQDCADNSDESRGLCKEFPLWTPPVAREPPALEPRRNSACLAPNITNGGVFSVTNPENQIDTGKEVTHIIYKCQSYFHLEGKSWNECYDGEWINKHPICTRYCPGQVLESVTFTAVCIEDGITGNCNKRVKPGTIAKTNCSESYKIPDHYPPQRLQCTEDGHWDYSPSRCVPICGQTKLDNAMVPWNVRIYMSSTRKNICEGTIINAKVVITAAHCFWDDTTSAVYSKSLYTVGAGKDVGGLTIARIEAHPKYKGIPTNFIADIAVIVLTNALQFSVDISPICIQWDNDRGKSIPTGTIGQASGWRLSRHRNLKQELKTISVPSISNGNCKSAVGDQMARYITNDKFCVTSGDRNTCQVSGGGSFAVKGPDGSFYLKGVTVKVVSLDSSCEFQIVSYTDVQYYEQFIKGFEVYNTPQ